MAGEGADIQSRARDHSRLLLLLCATLVLALSAAPPTQQQPGFNPPPGDSGSGDGDSDPGLGSFLDSRQRGFGGSAAELRCLAHGHPELPREPGRSDQALASIGWARQLRGRPTGSRLWIRARSAGSARITWRKRAIAGRRPPPPTTCRGVSLKRPRPHTYPPSVPHGYGGMTAPRPSRQIPV